MPAAEPRCQSGAQVGGAGLQGQGLWDTKWSHSGLSLKRAHPPGRGRGGCLGAWRAGEGRGSRKDAGRGRSRTRLPSMSKKADLEGGGDYWSRKVSSGAGRGEPWQRCWAPGATPRRDTREQSSRWTSESGGPGTPPTPGRRCRGRVPKGPIAEGGPGRRGPGASGARPRGMPFPGVRTRSQRERLGGPPARRPELGAPGGPRQRAVAMATGGRGAGAARKRGQRSASLRLPAPAARAAALGSPLPLPPRARTWGPVA